jgi:hypothetical protein
MLTSCGLLPGGACLGGQSLGGHDVIAEHPGHNRGRYLQQQRTDGCGAAASIVPMFLDPLDRAARPSPCGSRAPWIITL